MFAIHYSIVFTIFVYKYPDLMFSCPDFVNYRQIDKNGRGVLETSVLPIHQFLNDVCT
jgi:hypothetical protein